ncbi:unnamed protein product, partial [Closterium sp. NIES-53]
TPEIILLTLVVGEIRRICPRMKALGGHRNLSRPLGEKHLLIVIDVFSLMQSNVSLTWKSLTPDDLSALSLNLQHQIKKAGS